MDTLAQVDPNTLPTYFPPARIANVGGFVNLFIPIVFLVAGVLLLILFMMGAFKYMTSGGDPESVASAKRTFTFAIIGFIVIIFSFLIVRLLGFMLGVQVLPS